MFNTQSAGEWRNGTPLASRVVHEVTDHLWSCVRNLRVFPEDAWSSFVTLNNLNIEKVKIIASGPITSWQTDWGKQWKE